MSTDILRVEKAVKILWESPTGKAVMRDLRDHSSISKEAEQKIDSQLKFVMKMMLTVTTLTIGTQWFLLDKTFEGYEANILNQVSLIAEGSEDNSERINDLETLIAQVINKKDE